MVKPEAYFDGPVWRWFQLSYCAYFVLPRVLMCGMPRDWQERFVALMEEIEEYYDWSDIESNYIVLQRGEKGRFAKDKFCNYKYPPELPFKKKAES